MRKIHAKNLGVNWAKNFIVLELYKSRNKIAYDIEYVQLDFKGKGNKIKITSIDVTVNEKFNTAKIKINAQQEASLLEKILIPIENLSSKLERKLSEIGDNRKLKKYDKKETKRASIESIIEKKVKETITNEY